MLQEGNANPGAAPFTIFRLIYNTVAEEIFHGRRNVALCEGIWSDSVRANTVHHFYIAERLLRSLSTYFKYTKFVAK
jgi:hypothetical protein